MSNSPGFSVEKTVEAVEHGLEHCRRHHHHRTHEDERTSITVNVNFGSLSCCPPSGGTCPGGTGSGETGTGGTGSGGTGRPVHGTGTSDGSGAAGLGAPGGIISIPSRPPTVWPGPRTQLYLPFLFIRATAGDTAARPITGTFWESPDILILPGVAPSAAPPIPPDLGGVAKPNTDNTVYAHVCKPPLSQSPIFRIATKYLTRSGNLGQAPAFGALVEFYWFNPSLGFQSSDANLIGITYVDLDGRSGLNSHKLVKCPFSWVAHYENGGHECILVRISQPVTDPLSGPAWDASQNRHIGQRNIHVMTAAEAAAKPTIGVNVGPLYNQPANIAVARAGTNTMPWLHLATNSRTVIPSTGTPTGVVGITAAVPVGAGLPNLGTIPDPKAVGLIGNSTTASGNTSQVGFVTTDGNPGSGNANVYRVTGAQNGQTFGGYTVVILGS